MIAIQKSTQRSTQSAVHTKFLEMLPAIRRQAIFAFRKTSPEAREELIAASRLLSPQRSPAPREKLNDVPTCSGAQAPTNAAFRSGCVNPGIWKNRDQPRFS
jgi:hypothetical protein